MCPDRPDPTGRDAVSEALRRLGPLVADAPVSVDERMTLRSLAATLSQLAMGCALVRRGDDWVGIISERDVLAALSGDADPDTVWAADVMTEEIVTVDAGDRVLDAAGGWSRRTSVTSSSSTTTAVSSVWCRCATCSEG